MNRMFISRLLSYFSLLLFETVYFCICVSPDELKVPYVPHIVINRNKDEFDYDRLQNVIVKYLENKLQRRAYAGTEDTSTTLYDFLKTSTSGYQPQPYPSTSGYQSYSDIRNVNVQPQQYYSAVKPAYQTQYYGKPASTKNNSAVTAVLKVTTYQPHRHVTPAPIPLTFGQSYSNATSLIVKPSSGVLSKISNQMANLNFGKVPSKQPVFMPLRDVSKTDKNQSSKTKFPFGNEMKCSLRSSRYVYDGECVSRKPVVETVCADRCIRYEYRKTKKPFFLEHPNIERSTIPTELKKQVVALTCKDGDIQKQKVKLYCKDGTVINNVIRIVNSCICQEHTEKVQATKRSRRQNTDLWKHTMHPRSPQRMRMLHAF